MEQLNFVPVLLGTDCNAYGMARSFYEAYGVCSVAVGRGRLGATANSRIVTVEVVEPRLEEDEVFCQTLVAFAERYAVGSVLLLVPCGDTYVRLVAKHREILLPYYRFVCPDEMLLMRLSNKESLYTLCEEYGWALPQSVTVSVNTRQDLSVPLKFPVVIKPTSSASYAACHFPHKKNVFIAQSHEELESIVAAIYQSSYRDHLIVQEYVPGDDSHLRVATCYVGTDGRARLVALGQALLEEHSPDDIGSYAAVIPVEDRALARQLRLFLEAIGYRGFVNLNLKLDSRDGQYKLLQINPRQGRCSTLVTAQGYNLARFLVEDVLQEKETECVFAEGEALWSLVPTALLFEYVTDPSLLSRIRQLKRARKLYRPLWYRHDRSFRRWLYFHKRQAAYFTKYSRYFGKRSLED